MRELERFRDHCREMANWQPPKPRERLVVGSWCRDLRAIAEASDEWGPKHDQCGFEFCACSCHPKPEPPTGPTDAERTLWTRLADEVDAYLSTDEPEGLFT